MQLPIQAAHEGPYKDIQAFNGELSSWEAFWFIPRKLVDEPPEAAILRLANGALLQVCNPIAPVVLNSVGSCASGRFRQQSEAT